jgi:endonuclease/exonuclease/phosphatase family metal-dependent hydrolase
MQFLPMGTGGSAEDYFRLATVVFSNENSGIIIIFRTDFKIVKTKMTVKAHLSKAKTALRTIWRASLLTMTLLCFASIFISPARFWPAGFFSLGIPVMLLANIFLLIVNIRKRGVAFFLHLLAVVLGFAFIKVSFTLSANDDGGRLQVLSYNVRVFNNYSNLRNEEYESSKTMIAWSVEHEADIKCFQEFYNRDRSKVFNVKHRLEKAGWQHSHSKIVFTDRARAQFGMSIYSKYPIVSYGEVYDEKQNFLNSIYADIKVDSDTIRVYNTHLESMSINVENVVNTDRLARSYKDTGHRLRNGFMSRSVQVEALLADMENCPHRIILCGDLNELPYSYTYFSLRRHLHNAFEQAGNGFGFSYNGKLFFLRIDNQFFSPDMSIHNFTTHQDVGYSDHFPLSASYSW